MVAAEEARKEADGTGGSGRKGISKITSLKLEQADALKKELDKTELEVTSLRDVRENELAKAQTSIEVNLHGQSILARIKSLFKLIRKDLAALVTYIFFTVLLFSLEFIVIIMKHSLPPTSYDRRVAAMEQVSNRRLERLLAAGVQSLDPVENSLQERKMEMELSRALPTLFSERAGKNYHETNKSAA
jgi:hypothetical protein